jgi:hypothetical protein
MSILASLLGRVAGMAGAASSWQLVAGIALLAGAAGAWELQALRYTSQLATLRVEHAETMRAVADAAQKAAEDNQAKLVRQQAAVADLDRRNSKELSDARAESTRLRAAVADGTRRLSVAAGNPGGSNGMSGAAGAAGVGNGGAGRAELNRQDASALLTIMADGDKFRRQLLACQDYVRAIAGTK